ncbi:MAG: glycosyltransferase family 4 protein [Bacteroidales bacterium]|nr:glycosyltransferase family 4 protein [Bacteroidales bacterium]
MPTVLIITYYWPPSGGSAVLRWLKFAKYLRMYGWEPVIYTPSNPEPQEIDDSLIKDIPPGLEIIKRPITEPYSLYKWLTGKKQHERMGVALMTNRKKQGLAGKIALWIRSNLFIPDPRMLWITPSVKYLAKYLAKHPANLIISTGPPHSMHLIGRRLKNKTGIKWVADFRDPWTNIDFYQELMLARWADRRHRKLEQRVLNEADHIITVSPGMTSEFRLKGAGHVTTLTNGFDELPAEASKPDNAKFSITHLGSLPKSRNPENLWRALSELIRRHEPFATALEIKLIGKCDAAVDDSLQRYELQQYVTRTAFVPHLETTAILCNSSVLLLSINNTPNAKGILTNKFFEYLSARRPVIAIGPPDGDAATILRETSAGKIFGYNEVEPLKAYILELFNLYSHNKLFINSDGIEQYSRQNLSKQLSELLNRIVS